MTRARIKMDRIRSDLADGAITIAEQTLVATDTGPAHTVTNHWEPNRDVLDLKENKIAGVTVSSFDYVVNPLGQRESVATAGTAFPALPEWIWGYDSPGQVVSANHGADDTFDRGYATIPSAAAAASATGRRTFRWMPTATAPGIRHPRIHRQRAQPIHRGQRRQLPGRAPRSGRRQMLSRGRLAV